MCDYPLCPFITKPGDQWCVNHARHFGDVKPAAKKKAIEPLSVKRKTLQKEYVALVKAMLKENPNCSIKAKGCTGKASGMHHRQKRNANNLTDSKNLVRSCSACNLFIEEHPEHPISKKFTISRFKK